MRITYYWACICGASPLDAKNGRRWFDTESAALDAGRPERCTNRYCHSHSAKERPFEVHVLETGPEPKTTSPAYKRPARGALPMGSPNRMKSGDGRPGDPGYVPPRSGRKPDLDDLDRMQK